MDVDRAQTDWFHGVYEALWPLLVESQLDWREIRGGLAIEFDDGGDAVFLTASSLHRWLPKSGVSQDSAARMLLTEFQRVDAVRRQVLIGLRHHLVAWQVAVNLGSGGHWGLQFSAMMSSSIAVGPALTRLCQTMSAADAFQKLLENSWLTKVTPQQAEELVSRMTPPEADIAWRDEESPPISASSWMAFDCALLEEVADKLESGGVESAAQVVSRRMSEPWMEVFRGLEAELGTQRVGCSICMPRGTVDLEFTDKRDSLRVVLAGKHIAREIRDCGVAATVHRIVEDFRRLDLARMRAIHGILNFLSSRGYFENSFSFDPGLWFGRTHREVQFDPGKPLTTELRRHSDVEVVRDWLAKSFPAEAISAEELTPLMDSPLCKPKERRLPKSAPITRTTLAELDARAIAALDRLAHELIEKAKVRLRDGSRTGTLHVASIWSNPDWYRRGIDRWIDEAFFVEWAEENWASEHPLDCAATILMINGNHSPKASILERYAKYEGYFEEDMDDGIVWLLKEELPWPIGGSGDWPKFPLALGSLPPEMARERAILVRSELASAEAISDQSLKLSSLWDAVEQAAELDYVSASEWR